MDQKVSYQNSSLNSHITSSSSLNHTSNIATSSNKTNQTANFTKGEVISGEVIDLKNNEVTIALSDGREVTGKLASQTPLSIGDNVSFLVEDSTPKSLHLKLLTGNTNLIKDSTIDKALDAAGLTKNIKNRSIVQELLYAKLPIDKNSIVKLIQQSSQHKSVDIKTLVLMNKHSIPLTDSTISQIDKYMNGEQNLAKDISILTDSIIQVLEDNSTRASNTQEPSMKLNHQLLELISSKEHNTNNNSTLNNLLSNMDSDELASVKELIKQYAELSTTTSTPLINESIIQNISSGQDLEQILPVLKEMISDPNIMKSLLNHDGYAILDTILSSVNLQGNSVEIGNYLDPSKLQNLLNYMKEYPLSEQLSNKISTGSITSDEFITLLKEYSNTQSTVTTKELYSSKEFKGIIKEHLQEKWTLKPEELRDGDNLLKHLDKILHETNEVKEIMSKSSNESNTQTLQQQATTVNDNLNFIRHVNQLFHYIPIPLKLKEQITNGELFVYKNKRSNSNIEEGVKVLLHLDMDCLGSTDIMVEMKDKNIHCNFYFTKEDSITFITPYVSELETKIEQLGFSIHTSLTHKEDRINPMKDVIEESNPSTIERYNFDIRA